MKYVISYDFGTGGIKASLFDSDAVSHGFVFKEYPTYYPAPDIREQKPAQWWEAFITSTRELLALSDVSRDNVAALAISGHSLGVVAVDSEGILLSEYTPIWSDKRAGKEAEAFFRTVNEKEWYETTGNGFPPATYSLFKIAWYRDNMPDLYSSTACFLGTKDYINYRLTGRFCTDHSYASGCGAYNLRDNCYDMEYIKAAGVDAGKLPPIVESIDAIGCLTKEAAVVLGLSEKTVVCAGGVDNMCMALGAACCHEGDSYLSLGTSAWIAAAGEAPVLDFEKKPYVFVHYRKGLYISSTCIFAAGSALRWAKDNLGKNYTGYAELDADAAASPAGANGLLFNPSLAGGSSVYASPDVRGGFLGLDLRHTQADVMRACLEGIAMDLKISLDVLAKYTKIRPSMHMVGGGANSAIWRQIFADVFRMETVRTSVGQDTAALGAAALAFMCLGVWKSPDKVAAAHKILDRCTPNPDHFAMYDRRQRLFEKYAEALTGLNTFTNEEGK